MLDKIARLPFRVARRLVRTVLGGGAAPAPSRPSPTRPDVAEADEDEPPRRGGGHSHDHGHGHDHGHDHGHGHARAADLEVEAKDVLARVKAGAPPLMIDVRSLDEIRGGCIEGAEFYCDDQLMGRHKELDREREIVVYCAAGARSFDAAAFLSEQGFENVRSLSGGISEWSRAGGAVVLPDDEVKDAPFRIGQFVRITRPGLEANGMQVPAERARGRVQRVRPTADGPRFEVSCRDPRGGAALIRDLTAGELVLNT